MLFYQNMDGMPDNLHHNGCYYMSLLYKHFDQLTQQQIIDLWNGAHLAGYIDSSDIIQKPQELVDYLGLSLTYIDGHFDPGTSIPTNCYVIEEWYNPNTKFFHFMLGDGLGNIEYDPIEGGSLTHKEGHLYSLRFYNEA